MASDAEINGKRLADELAKPIPDMDIVYNLKMTQPYWNTVDTEMMRRGAEKLHGNSLSKQLERLAPKQDIN